MVATRVFVGNLPSDTNERDLERFFRGYGRMREVLLKNGYGFVEFDDYRDAEDAVYELNGKKILGVRVTVEKARGTPRGRDQYYARDRDYPPSGRGGGGGRGGGEGGGGGGRGDYHNNRGNDRYGPPTRTAHRLIVENLSSRVSWQDLKDYMRQAGEVTYADAHKKQRNEGVVEFASSSDMKNALDKLDGSEINGRRIKLVQDKQNGGAGAGKTSRSSSYSSRSRSRSRSPRKSRSRSSSRSRSKSAAKKSKSRSVSRKKSVDRSRSHSRRKSVDRSRSNSRRKSVDRSRSRSRVKSEARSPTNNRRDTRSNSRRVKSRSTSRRPKSKSRSTSRRPKSAERSRSRSPRKSRDASKERSRSKSLRHESKDLSRSRSRSRD